MDPRHWHKITNNGPTIPVSYIKSTTKSKIQQGSRHYRPQRQEHCQNKYSIKIPIVNEIRYIQAIGNKLISIIIKTPRPNHIVNVVKIPIRYYWYDSIFSNYDKWQNLPHSLHHFYDLCYHQIHKYSNHGHLLM